MRAFSRLLASCCALAFAACPPATTPPDGGTTPDAPTVASVTPATGPVTGGTQVQVAGTGFGSGAQVTFGSVTAPQVIVDSPTRLTVRTPAVTMAGAVDVTVTLPGGASGTLAGGFTFAGVSARTITEAVLQNPAASVDQSGTAMIPVTVLAQVESPGVTVGAGQGPGMRAQVGYAATLSTPPNGADFTWSDAVYLGDADGTTVGDLKRDAYRGNFSVPGLTGNTTVTYYLAARFSVDDATTWTFADRDGSSNGIQPGQFAQLTLSRASVEWCKLGGQVVDPPPVVRLREGEAGSTIYGQVFKTGVTDVAGAGAGISGELGYGVPGSDPATWTWGAATFNVDTGSGANDEFGAVLPNPGPGSYAFAFRFNHQGGPWAYCDADGSTSGGFTAAQSGSLVVTPLGVDRCVLQFPAAASSLEGQPSELIYGRVFGQGVTDLSGPAAGMTAELGVGPQSAPPTDATWTWAAATYNTEVTAGGEEFQARLTGPAPGTHGYVYRFRYQTGPWTYCDLDSSDNGYQGTQAGVLTALPYDLDECFLEATTATFTVRPGATTPRVRAGFRIPLLTPAAGAAPNVTAEVGYGAVGTAPGTWTTWTAASFDTDTPPLDVYSGQLTAPATPGTSEVAYRVRLGAGAFHYCDADGASNGYQSAQGGRMTVSALLIDSCALNTVSDFAVPGGGAVTASARVLVTGLTEAAGAAAGLTVQVGVGTQGDNASSSAAWGWKTAPFSADVSGTGEDMHSLTFFPAYSGNRAVSARASLDGVAWTYCDLDGTANGYDVAQQYNVAVGTHDVFDWCNLQFPATVSQAVDGGVGLVYGRVYEPGYTPGGAAPITAELGFGLKVEDPGLAWRWVPASFNSAFGNDNEYQALLPALDAGTAYAFRYTLDGGSYCYGDLNGNGSTGAAQVWGGFSGEAAGSVPNLGRVEP